MISFMMTRHVYSGFGQREVTMRCELLANIPHPDFYCSDWLTPKTIPMGWDFEGEFPGSMTLERILEVELVQVQTLQPKVRRPTRL